MILIDWLILDDQWNFYRFERLKFCYSLPPFAKSLLFVVLPFSAYAFVVVVDLLDSLIYAGALVFPCLLVIIFFSSTTLFYAKSAAADAFLCPALLFSTRVALVASASDAYPFFDLPRLLMLLVSFFFWMVLLLF